MLDLEGRGVALTTQTVNGDNSGHIRVHPSQSLAIKGEKLTMSAGVHSWSNSSLQLPLSWDCREVDFYLRGQSNIKTVTGENDKNYKKIFKLCLHIPSFLIITSKNKSLRFMRYCFV